MEPWQGKHCIFVGTKMNCVDEFLPHPLELAYSVIAPWVRSSLERERRAGVQMRFLPILPMLGRVKRRGLSDAFEQWVRAQREIVDESLASGQAVAGLRFGYLIRSSNQDREFLQGPVENV